MNCPLTDSKNVNIPLTVRAEMKDSCVNHVSMDVQSFAEEQLQAYGRVHGVTEVDEGVVILRRAGFRELSLDIMSGLPGNTVAGLERSLYRVLSFVSTHLSVYDLIVEEGTGATTFSERQV
jgi:oxygen-independent coproporphyrinogen-3 oxidase